MTHAPAGLLNEKRKGKGRKGRREGARGQFAVSEIGKLKSIVVSMGCLESSTVAEAHEAKPLGFFFPPRKL